MRLFTWSAAVALVLVVAACGAKSAPSLYGTVVRLESGARVPDATVTYTMDGKTATTKSDSSGTFTIRLPSEKVPASVEVVVTLEGFTEVRRTVSLADNPSDLGKFGIEKVKTPPPGK